MLQGQWLWALLLAGLAVFAFSWRTRTRRIAMRIEHIPSQRLDNTPERSEIVSAVKVRSRHNDEPARPLQRQKAEPRKSARAAAVRDQPPVTAAEPSVPLAPLMPEPVIEPLVDVISATLPEPEPAPVVTPEPPALTQTDLFAEVEEPAAEEPMVASAAVSTEVPSPSVYSVHVIARAQPFAGQELAQLLQQYGLRFGDMAIFHRHEKPSGQGDVLFSLARSHEPGIFEPDMLPRQQIEGVSLFMSLEGGNRLMAFDLMIDTARRLAKELQADLLDATTSPVLPSQLELWRDEVIAHERQRLLAT